MNYKSLIIFLYFKVDLKTQYENLTIISIIILAWDGVIENFQNHFIFEFWILLLGVIFANKKKTDMTKHLSEFLTDVVHKVREAARGTTFYSHEILYIESVRALLQA
jgi:hypothetical protein